MKNVLIVIIFLFGFTPIIKAQVPPIIYVASDGSGDYNCNGTSDQVEINLALDFVAANTAYTTVYLKGSTTYWIDEPIYISENTTLEGNTSSKIKLIDNAGWNTQFKPLIGQKGTTFTFGLADTSISTGNITIRGFEIDGNRINQTEPSGNSYYTMIQLQNCYNITINDMYLHDNLSDAIQTGYTTFGHSINSNFYNLRIHNNGHDGLYLSNVEDFNVYNCHITDNRTDAGIRMQFCNHFKIHDNIVGNDPDRQYSGGIGISVQAKGSTPVNDVEIYNNYLFGRGYYHGIWLWHTNGGGTLNTHRDVYIHHNIISWYRKSGIGIEGFNNTKIENNIFETNEEAGITFENGDPVNQVVGFKTYVKNNIIIHNKTYGINNKQPAVHTFISHYNDIYENEIANYNNTTSTTDIYDDPLFNCNYEYYDKFYNDNYYIFSPLWRAAEVSGDFSGNLGADESKLVYHLKSQYGRWNGIQWAVDTITSPCIDAGDPFSIFSAEQNFNGNQINIGAFGNTSKASKSDFNTTTTELKIFPNPVKKNIHFEGNTTNYSFELISITGAIVLKGTIINNKIDASNLKTGVYFIKIIDSTNHSIKTIKLVKE